MKIDPIKLILDNNYKFEYKFYFISGNEITLMEKIKDLVISNYSQDDILNKEDLKDISFYKNETGLFETRKIYIIKDSKNLNEDNIDNITDNDDVFVFLIENSSKIKPIKNYFIKNKNFLLIDCYELTKENKINILNKIIQDYNINLTQELYWFILERLDNKYIFLEKELEKLRNIEQENLNIENIKKIISSNTTSGLDRFFFEVFNDNDKIINTYNYKVTNHKEVNEFYFYFKRFCNLIIDNYNESDFTKSIPIYLFREKNLLLDVFKRFNDKKRNSLLKLMLKTEKSIRLEGELSVVIGLRFLLNFKRLITS
tara:strand:- start:29518 stop:30459 length:942 start_codon:yes stop_codon:yes gene_type:complete